MNLILGNIYESNSWKILVENKWQSTQKMIGKAMIKEWVTSIESFSYETKANNCETMIKERNMLKCFYYTMTVTV